MTTFILVYTVEIFDLRLCSLPVSLQAPTLEGIQFILRENNWLDGFAKAMQEALARLCGQSINQIKGTHFEYYLRRGAMGQPPEVPHHRS